MCRGFGLCSFAVALSALLGYLIGSVNISIILTRKSNDIRNMGSGNAGFTNMMRTVGVLPAVITLIWDALKCFIAIVVAKAVFGYFFSEEIPGFFLYQYAVGVAGFSCVIGHVYPCFFGFRGGKGVVTAGMYIFMSDARVFIILLLLFVVILLIYRMISLASVVSFFIYPVVMIATMCFKYLTNQSYPDFFCMYLIFISITSLLISTLIIWKHRSNIHRIINKTESKVIFF